MRDKRPPRMTEESSTSLTPPPTSSGVNQLTQTTTKMPLKVSSTRSEELRSNTTKPPLLCCRPKTHLLKPLKLIKSQTWLPPLRMPRPKSKTNILTWLESKNTTTSLKLSSMTSIWPEIAIKVGLLGEKVTAFTNAEEAKNAYQTTEDNLK